jgi:hypothetical protein
VRASRLTAVVAVVATLATASAAGAKSNLKVCRLLTAKQIATIPGVSSKCTEAKPLPGPGSTIYGGTWAGKTPTSPSLQVNVSTYADKSVLKLAKSNLNQGLVGTAKKVTGIGSAAYGATGASAAEIHFAAGKDVVAVILTSIGKKPKLTPALKALAKAIAAKL